MYDTRVKAAQRTVTAADADIKTAQDAQAAAESQVSAFLAARAYVSPDAELTSVQDQITQFQVRETDARATGNVAAANTYTARLTELAQRRSDLGKDAAAYAALLDQVDQAKQQVGRAQTAKEDATRSVAEVKPEGNTTFGKRNEAQDRAATIWRRTLAVMLACFVLSVLLVAWLASLAPEADKTKAGAADADSPTLDDDDDVAPPVAPVTVDAAEPAPADLEPVDLEPVELEPSVKVPSRYRSTRQPKRGSDGVTVSAQPS